jgi:hypothetical protein
MNVSDITLENAGDFVWYYIGEVLQAFVALVIYKYLTTKGALDLKSVIHGSLVIGMITAIIEYFDPSFNRNIKSGAMMAIGGNLVKNIK